MVIAVCHTVWNLTACRPFPFKRSGCETMQARQLISLNTPSAMALLHARGCASISTFDLLTQWTLSFWSGGMKIWKL